MKEVDQLAEWADSLLEGGDGGEASEESDGDTSGTAGEGGAEDAPKDDLDDLAEAENDALNPVGIPEGEYEDDASPVSQAITRRILLQRNDLLSKYGPAKVMAAIDDVADFVGDTDEIGSSDVSGWIKQVEQSLGGQVEESGLQAYLGNKKYGKEGMDALRKAGREHAGKEKMANIRAKYDKLDEVEMEEGEVTHTPTGLKHKATDKYGAGEDPDVAHPRDAKDLNRLDKNKIKSLDASMGIKWKNNGPKGLEVDETLDEVDMGQYDAVKSTPSGKEDDDVFKRFREKVRQYGDELEQRQKEKSEKEVDEGLDADQKRVGQLGPTEKVKNNNIGKLVGANENFIGMAPQAVAEGQEDLEAILRIIKK
jgi:hypothetical protein